MDTNADVYDRTDIIIASGESMWQSDARGSPRKREIIFEYYINVKKA